MNKVQLFFSNLWIYIKKYWLFVILAFGLVYIVIFVRNKSQNYEKLWNDYKEQTDAYKKQMDDLRNVYEQNIQKQREIETKYNETISLIERNHQEALATLDRTKRTEVRKIVEETHDNPEEMAKRINSVLGIPLFTP